MIKKIQDLNLTSSRAKETPYWFKHVKKDLGSQIAAAGGVFFSHFSFNMG